MINLNNLERQHIRIIEEVEYLDEEIKEGSISANPSDLALHINRLAGLLRIHLIEEDRFLYPDLLKCQDDEIRAIAYQYISEMGNLIDTYTDFKNDFNVSSKIVNNQDRFLKEATIIVNALKVRIAKEDNGLYHLIKLKNL